MNQKTEKINIINYIDKFIYLVTKINFQNNEKSEFKNNMILKIMSLLLTYLNQRCGADTVINYRILPIDTIFKYVNNEKQYKIILTFPVQQHEINSNDDLIFKNIDIIKNYIINKDWEKDHRQYLWLWRVLRQLNFKPESYIKYEDYKSTFNWGLDDKIIDKYMISYQENKTKDGIIIKEIIDPLIKDYGLYINLSTTFNELDYGYNYLHYYEHIMTYAWKKLSQQNMIELNGGTTCNGVCYVYNIHETKKSLELYLDKYIKFHSLSRRKDFWNKCLTAGLKTELERTISETLLEKSMSQMAKTDPFSQDNYNTEILRYYSNKPFEIITYTPEKIDVIKFLNQYNFSKKYPIEKPKKIEFDYYPIHVLRDKQDRGFHILYLNENIKLNNDVVLGVDNYIISNENLGQLNTILMDILLKKEEELKKILTNNPTPLSNLNMNMASCNSNDINGYFIGCFKI